MRNIKEILRALKLAPVSSTAIDAKGELEVLATGGKLNYHNGTTASPVVTESHTATLTNKTIDADNSTISNLEVDNLKSGVLITSDTLTGASDTKLASALAIKTYVDNKAAAQNEASEISFSPAGTIEATNVQDMGEELDNDIQTHIADTDAHGATGAVVGTTNTQTLTNKTLTSPVINSPTGIVKADVGLGNVDNTSDSTKNSATATLTNKTIDGDDNTIQDISLSSLKTVLADASKFLVRDASGNVISNTKAVPTGVVVGTTDTQTLTNKTLTSPSISSPTGLVKGDVGLGNVDNTSDSTKNSATATLTNKTLTSLNVLAFNGTVDTTTTGAGATVPEVTTGYVRLTDSSLTSISMITANHSGQVIILENKTGNEITISNETGATAANRILTGTGSNLSLANNASILLFYDGGAVLRWQVIGGSGSGGGSSDIAVTTQTSNYTILNTDGLVIGDATSGAITFTLPSAAGITGRAISIIKSDSSINRITIDGNGSETINGDTNVVIGSQYDVLTVISNGTNWIILSKNITVSCRYSSNSGQAVTTGNAVIYEDLGFDTHSAYNTSTGIYTSPINGKYFITAFVKTGSVSGAIGNALAIDIQASSGVLRGLRDVCENTTSRIYSASVSAIIELTKGQEVYIRFNESLPAVNLDADNTYNYLSIVRIGN